jgi:hypothetical protein
VISLHRTTTYRPQEPVTTRKEGRKEGRKGKEGKEERKKGRKGRKGRKIGLIIRGHVLVLTSNIKYDYLATLDQRCVIFVLGFVCKLSGSDVFKDSRKLVKG